MNSSKELRIIVISQPGRRLENLISLAESIEFASSVIEVSNCEEAHLILQKMIPTILIIDYRCPDSYTSENLKYLISERSVIHTLLLRSRNEKIDMTGFSISDLIFEDLSVGNLNTLVSNIQAVSI